MLSETIKSDFPIFERPHPSGHPLTYLDNAATSQKPNSVIESLTRHYTQNNTNIGRGIYDLAYRVTEEYEAARKLIAQFIGAKSSHEILFTSGATNSINMAAQSFLIPDLSAGDNVVTTMMEHHANFIPWQQACKTAGAEFRIANLKQDGSLDYDHLQSLVDQKTKLIAVVHISNTSGVLNHIEEVRNIGRKYDTPILLDAAQSIISQEMNVEELGVDFLCFSGHKMFGPTGIGILYARDRIQKKMTPCQFGGGMIKTVELLDTQFSDSPSKFEAGTPHIAGVIGLTSAIHYIQRIGQKKISDHIRKLAEMTVTKLHEIDGIKVLPFGKQNMGIISFYDDQIHPHDFATILDRHGVAVRAGHHCTEPLMKMYQLPGTVRVSFSVYNHLTDIDRLISGIKAAQKMFV